MFFCPWPFFSSIPLLVISRVARHASSPWRIYTLHMPHHFSSDSMGRAVIGLISSMSVFVTEGAGDGCGSFESHSICFSDDLLLSIHRSDLHLILGLSDGERKKRTRRQCVLRGLQDATAALLISFHARVHCIPVLLPFLPQRRSNC